MIVYVCIVLVLLILIISYLLWRLQRTNKDIKKMTTHIQLQRSATIDVSQIESIETVLNPHLFKNILNTVQSHAYQTYLALDKLANVLDYILYDSKKRFVTPREELIFAKNLIDINRVKLSPLFELTVKEKIDESCNLFDKQVLVPLISIDLIENAFKHADLQSPNAYISIVFEFKNNVFSLIVSNRVSSRKRFVKEKSGIGSHTFQQRLDIFYKGCYVLERIIDDGAFIAHLKIDIDEYQNKMRNS